MRWSTHCARRWLKWLQRLLATRSVAWKCTGYWLRKECLDEETAKQTWTDVLTFLDHCNKSDSEQLKLSAMTLIEWDWQSIMMKTITFQICSEHLWSWPGQISPWNKGKLNFANREYSFGWDEMCQVIERKLCLSANERHIAKSGRVGRSKDVVSGSTINPMKRFYAKNLTKILLNKNVQAEVCKNVLILGS